ncbi:LysE family translocator [Acinetobacter rongchengensis]|uniref:LysE family translocator n=1 Tax=Acinetobacter rongchengensis TaxID=2419601 RepID=A0A3A8EPB1_9GAMM|nr:LysE family translocator [Acinetobacter rongchengensis]RKG36008.1 LysE family translocator [Acinetobacter rongchengensis]
MSANLLAFALISLGMALTPGPNMIYLISRSLCQGKKAGFVSLGGTALGFLFYMLCAAFGITALLMTIPLAYDTLKIAGAIYLIFLAWKAIRSPHSPFEDAYVQTYSNSKLFLMGFLTNLLNPKIAMMYLALLPQFIKPDSDVVLLQTLTLGIVQIIISLLVNSFFIITASTFTQHLNRHVLWLKLQKWFMGTVFFGLATQILLSARK